MKKYIILLIAVIPFLESFKCGKTNDYYNPNIPTVKLKATLNNSAETIKLGDTLKFTLTVPENISAISKLTGDSTKVAVNSVQECMYNFTFYSIDTISKTGTRITSLNNAFVSLGSLKVVASVYTTNYKPYVSVLNIVPPAKGIYYVDFGRQETSLQINNSFKAGLRVNVNVADKHWNLTEPYYPGITNSLQSLDLEGYGNYYFRVN